jgi:hypothetical protein
MSGGLRSLAGAPTLVCDPQGPPLDSERAATDLIGEAFGAGTRRVAIPLQRLPPAFFDPKTRLAGEVLQKFVN